MHPSFVPPRRVLIGDAAWFAGTTPRAVRHYEQIGLLPEPERGSDGRRRYDHGAVIRLLWIRRMVDTGVALDDVRRALDAAAPADAGADADPGATADVDVSAVLDRLEEDLAAQEAELRRRREAVRRLRARGSRRGLLDDFVAARLEGLPEEALSRAHLDTLLVTERMLGPLGAAVHAGRYLALAAHPHLRAESDRLDAAEQALDDTIAVDDPRVARLAAERHAFERALQQVVDDSGQAEEDEALLAAGELHPEVAGGDAHAGPVSPRGHRNALAVLARVPYDLSPARLRCLEIAEELAARDAPSS